MQEIIKYVGDIDVKGWDKEAAEKLSQVIKRNTYYNEEECEEITKRYDQLRYECTKKYHREHRKFIIKEDNDAIGSFHTQVKREHLSDYCKESIALLKEEHKRDIDHYNKLEAQEKKTALRRNMYASQQECSQINRRFSRLEHKDEVGSKEVRRKYKTEYKREVPRDNFTTVARVIGCLLFIATLVGTLIGLTHT